ncbi:type VI secretion system baseplate subunit TssE [Enterovibrio norvegicus]|uniref:Lysozyme n=2 Tax=Enterovibrio norvegicus TaxID=188144 RepID=A0A2N7LAY7_9GAMM|nr:type VI secretion system baseplate subunit TssE [Enterovibrio norvegicus]MCC4800592.1 type VI secretion system baseplate subunit TssE [Enterovibrio norvegicus]OEF56714.1 lysozyme [Enterovibrio norvegicus]PMH66069.1 lysozyme [Enterovibrio norvegicus]PMI31744.1 lysozyme [Enterovibrio norvegicus]PMI38621.1 lysozyme [Enterovibrio norvegicus]
MALPDAEDSAYGVSFFQRLEADAPKRSVTQGPDPADVFESLKHNVSNLLNARIGESLSAPELGLIDFNDASLSSHDLAVQIRRAIRHCLQTYEPRLKNMDIIVQPDNGSPLNLRFQIVASVNVGALHRKFQIDLLLDSNRKYRVV